MPDDPCVPPEDAGVVPWQSEWEHCPDTDSHNQDYTHDDDSHCHTVEDLNCESTANAVCDDHSCDVDTHEHCDLSETTSCDSDHDYSDHDSSSDHDDSDHQ